MQSNDLGCGAVIPSPSPNPTYQKYQKNPSTPHNLKDLISFLVFVVFVVVGFETLPEENPMEAPRRMPPIGVKILQSGAPSSLWRL